MRGVGGGRRPGLRHPGRHVDRHQGLPHHRRPYPAGRGGRRPCRDHLAAALRHGQGEVLPAHLRPAAGAEAERIGLVSLAVEDAELDAKAVEVATRLAEGAQSAIRWTKYALNNWLRQAGPAFDASLALEFMGFTGPEVKEGLQSHLEKRQPRFPPDTPV